MYIIVDEFSSPNKPYYLVRMDNNNYDISADKNKALTIKELSKAENILNSLPKILKRYSWNIIPDIEIVEDLYSINDNQEVINYNYDYDYDNILSETKQTVSQLSKTLHEQQILRKSYREEYQQLRIMLSEIDKELLDMDHHIEFNIFSASKGYKILALRKKKLEQRRQIKNAIFVYQHFISTADDSKINNAISSIEGLEGQKYAPRTNVYDQLKYI